MTPDLNGPYLSKGARCIAPLRGAISRATPVYCRARQSVDSRGVRIHGQTGFGKAPTTGPSTHIFTP